MKNTKPQSVQGFLASKKLLSTKNKNTNKSKLNRTTANLPSDITSDKQQSLPQHSPRRVRQSYKNNDLQNQSDIYSDQKYKQNIQLKNSLNLHVKNTEYQGYQRNHNKYQKNLGDLIIPKTKSKTPSHGSRIHEQNQSYQPDLIYPKQQDHIYSQSRSRYTKNAGIGINQAENFSQVYKSLAFQKHENSVIKKNPYESLTIKKNPQIAHLQAKQLLNSLMKIKHGLQHEISELDHLLNNIQANFRDMDQDYQKIKKNILEYTSKYLDAAYTQYKQIKANDVNWIKYQNLQNAGYNKINQLSRMIQQAQVSDGKIFKSNNQLLKPHQLNQIIHKYQRSIVEVSDARRQCSSLKPKITQQRLKYFQKALAQIGRF